MNLANLTLWACSLLLAACAGKGTSLHSPELRDADPVTLRSAEVERVEIRFHHDARNRIYVVRDRAGNALRTGLNGTVEGEIRLSSQRVAELLEAQHAGDGGSLSRVGRG